MNKPFIIGVAGGTGSGKTFLLKCFLAHFKPEQVCLVSQDDYYIPVEHHMTVEENMYYNFDLPSTIDNDHFLNDIKKLINYETVYKQEYTFNNPNVIPKTLEVKPAPIIIVEGLFILYFKAIADLLDMRIFIEADEEIALARRLKRDLEERGYSHEDVMYRWHNHVQPSYKEYLLPFKKDCDKVIVNDTQLPDDIIKITNEISKELRAKVFGE